MIRLLSRGWRNDLADVALSASRSIVVAAPYIKQDEAVWFCGLLRPGIEVVTLANVDAEAISVAALDLAALRCFAEASPSATTMNTSSSKANVTAGPGNASCVTRNNISSARGPSRTIPD